MQINQIRRVGKKKKSGKDFENKPVVLQTEYNISNINVHKRRNNIFFAD